ncbi:hypothetical protein [Streptomyces sp. NPDC051567]|uniref:hypothetical protein n=1 Tax=Streptomyces sp. NPDC051567 TaxID=3365660 RepID=UPI003788E4F3
MWSLTCLDDKWPQSARITSAERLDAWHHELAGPALAARLKTLRPVLDSSCAELPATTAATARDDVLALLEKLITARHGVDTAGVGPIDPNGSNPC